MILEDAARLGFDGTLTYIVYNICIRSLRHYCYLVNTRDHLQIKVQRIFSYKKSRSYKKNFPTNKSSYQTVMETIQFLVFFFSFFFFTHSRSISQDCFVCTNTFWEHVFTRIVSFNMLAAMGESIWEKQSRDAYCLQKLLTRFDCLTRLALNYCKTILLFELDACPWSDNRKQRFLAIRRLDPRMSIYIQR